MKSAINMPLELNVHIQSTLNRTRLQYIHELHKIHVPCLFYKFIFMQIGARN
jgi:hypothetical protein